MSTERAYHGVEAVPDAVLDLLGHRDSLRLLEATIEEPRGAGDLIAALDIPRSTVYRRIETFAEFDLVRSGGAIADGVGPEMTIASNLDSLELTLDDGAYRLTIDLREPATVADRDS